MAVIFSDIYFIPLLKHTATYTCKNCGKVYSQKELSGSLPNYGRRLLIVSGGVLLIIVVAIGLAIFQSNNNPVNKSIKTFKQPPSADIKPYIDKSNALFDQMKQEKDQTKLDALIKENIDTTQQAVNVAPNDPKAWSQFADANSWWRNTGNYAQVVLDARKKAESLDPNNYVYINYTAEEYYNQKDYNDSILEYNKTIRLVPNDGYAFLGLAQDYQALKIYDSARENYQKAIDSFTKENTDGSLDGQILQAKQGLASLPK